MNPRDIMTDAIHNFHPQYQQYTQYSSDNKRYDDYHYLFDYEGLICTKKGGKMWCFLLKKLREAIPGAILKITT